MYTAIQKINYITFERFIKVSAISPGMSGDVAPYAPLIGRRSLVARLTLIASSGLGDLEVAHHSGQFF